MKRTLKYFLVASILTTGALVSCNNDKKPNTSIVPPTTSETIPDPTPSTPEVDKPLYIYKEVGKKTETSKLITCIVNLSDDPDGVYRRVHVEPGEKLKKFGCIVTGYYGSLWFYDRYGTKPFDFENTVITEDLTLYAYNIPRVEDPEINTPSEEGEFVIDYINGKNSSIVDPEGLTLKTKANLDEMISFKIEFNYHADENVEVKFNDEVITPDENGIYTVQIKGNSTISVSDTEIVDPSESYTYTLKVGENSYEMTKNPSNTTEYMVSDITLNKGDTFKVDVFDGLVTKSYDKALTMVDEQVKLSTFVCEEPGVYSFFFDINRNATWVSGPVVEFKFVNNPEWIAKENPVIYAWNWMEGQDGNWKEVTINADGTLSINLPKDTYGIKLLAFDRDTFVSPSWDSKIGETPNDILLDPTAREIDASKLWAYYFGETEISTFYFKAPKSWTTVKYYTWGASEEATWPGKDMTLFDSDKNIYKVELDVSKYMSIIFNNGSGTQTVNISLIGIDSNTIFELGNKNGEGKYEVTNTLYSK